MIAASRCARRCVAARAAPGAAPQASRAGRAAVAEASSSCRASTFHLGAEHLSGDDQRFVWDANFGGELDVVDYGAGRLTFCANYQVILGEEFAAVRSEPGQLHPRRARRRARAAGFEVAGVFYHQSRHLSDRAKIAAGRLEHARRPGACVRLPRGRTRRGRPAPICAASSSSRSSTTAGSSTPTARGRRRSAAAASACIAAGGVAHPRRGRDAGTAATQTGFRAEGGVRLEGTRRRARAVSSPPNGGSTRIRSSSATVTWVTAGFRLLSR